METKKTKVQELTEGKAEAAISYSKHVCMLGSKGTPPDTHTVACSGPPCRTVTHCSVLKTLPSIQSHTAACLKHYLLAHRDGQLRALGYDGVDLFENGVQVVLEGRQ